MIQVRGKLIPWRGSTIGGEPQSSKLKQGLNLANFLG
jgi:hypothetical protein